MIRLLSCYISKCTAHKYFRSLFNTVFAFSSPSFFYIQAARRLNYRFNASKLPFYLCSISGKINMYHTQQPFVRQRTSSTSSACTTLSSTTSSSTVTSMAPIKTTSKRNAENVQVTVRCRPPNKNEYGSCWDVQQSKIVSKDHKLKKQHEFQFGTMTM